MKSVLLLTNILTPYRVYFYELLYKEFMSRNWDFNVLVTAETEPNRNWKYDDLKTNFTHLLKGHILTLSNNIFIHVNTGVKKFVVKKHPQIVISAGTYLYPALWSLISNKKKNGYKLFYWNETHSHEERNYAFWKLWIREKIRKYIFKQFDGFCYAGEWSLDLIEQYCSKNALKIFLPNVVNNTFYNSSLNITDLVNTETRQRYDIDDTKCVLLCPARLTAVKGQIEFLKLFKQYDNRDKFQILFVGDGDKEEEIKTIIESDHEWNIKILGYKNQNEMLKLYSICDYVLLPSFSDPNPLTCIEALWCGKPLLLSNHVGNSPEVIREGKNGYIFSLEAQDSLYEVLSKIEQNNSAWYIEAKMISLEIANSTYKSCDVAKRIVNEIINIL